MVKGAARYTFDTEIEGLLHIKLLRSPHPHARIISIDKEAALAGPGVHAVLTHEDAPQTLFSTARHERDWMDPDDTRLLEALRMRDASAGNHPVHLAWPDRHD